MQGPSSQARGWAKPTTRVFYSKLIYPPGRAVASIDTQCIDSNLESGRYISRVLGWARGFLSLLVGATRLNIKVVIYTILICKNTPKTHASAAGQLFLVLIVLLVCLVVCSGRLYRRWWGHQDRAPGSRSTRTASGRLVGGKVPKVQPNPSQGPTN